MIHKSRVQPPSIGVRVEVDNISPLPKASQVLPSQGCWAMIVVRKGSTGRRGGPKPSQLESPRPSPRTRVGLRAGGNKGRDSSAATGGRSTKTQCQQLQLGLGLGLGLGLPVWTGCKGASASTPLWTVGVQLPRSAGALQRLRLPCGWGASHHRSLLSPPDGTS